MTDNDKVLRLLQDNPNGITAEDAYAAIGTMRLAARVYDLRRMGHAIEDVTVGNAKRYRLVRPGEMPDPPEPPRPPSDIVYARCTGCGDVKPVDMLGSKYGKPQIVGEVRGLRLWEARCSTCNRDQSKGLQAIWKEQQ